jgi:hypothetical protein
VGISAPYRFHLHANFRKDEYRHVYLPYMGHRRVYHRGQHQRLARLRISMHYQLDAASYNRLSEAVSLRKSTETHKKNRQELPEKYTRMLNNFLRVQIPDLRAFTPIF